MAHKCQWPGGVIIKPDGVNELDPCQYKISEVHKNVTVEVLRCSVCGCTTISWKRQKNTVDICFGDGEEEIEDE